MLVISFRGLGNSVRGKILWQIACLTLIWMVWQERNNRIFEDKGRTEEVVWDLIWFYSSLWASCTEAFRGVPLSILQINWIGEGPLILPLGWKAFFEEPIMLIAFVLLGRNLEQRAKIKATSDMTGLLSILPAKARLFINGDSEEFSSTVEVPCNNLSVGDQIVVLPGDRVPADGIVRAGRSTVDESSFTGEPLPVTKLPGAEVSAGSINLNGTLRVEVRRPGGETAMGDIVRLVEAAQSREAPVQRLADKVVFPVSLYL
ncbi:Copper-transporting ATPase PAA1, chloroplastic [Vitis vinifera]|uniref:Copper-transporting ATPase PAA1, chloroplastic n=1 Tax=Vitis vinifera TaxID=29760 RepID=A0A438H413_VITVI|nr:Copper-transporting ATPase PAA1, chloroplastic [Vitis vinifera]